MTRDAQTGQMATIARRHRPRDVGSTDDDVSVSVGDGGDRLCLTITGELDLMGASVLRIVAEPRLAGPLSHLVVDVEEVSFCDVAGLEALLSLRDLAAANGCHLRLHRPSAPLQWLLELTGTTSSFPVTDS